jgi:phosphatidylserine decarboxylase
MAMNNNIAKRRSAIAAEGIPLLLGCVALALVCWRLDWLAAAAAAGLFAVWLFFLFRDPARAVPPLPAAIYAPVDGRIVAEEQIPGAGEQAAWRRLRIRVNHLGAYTVRAPIEGTIMPIESSAIAGQSPEGLRLRSEEGDDVLLAFPRGGPLRSPRSFVRYGERLGQGHRFAYLRLAPVAEVLLPAGARLKVAVGEAVKAGDTVLAELISA